MAKTKIHVGAAIGRWAIRIFLIVWAVITLFPLIWTFYTSFKTNREFLNDPWGFPAKLQWENYSYAWNASNMSSFFGNSVFLVLVTLILTLVMATTTAYILAKYRHAFIRFLEKLYIVFMVIPQILLLVPLYFMCLSMNLTDNLFVLSLLYALQGLPFLITLLVPFLKGINDSLFEAAKIDGGNEFLIFFRIVVPLSLPAIGIVIIMNVVGTWNEFSMALTFIKDSSKYTIPIGINYLSGSTKQGAKYVELFAGLVIALIPILIIYGIFQKQLQNGLSSADGVKG